MNILKLELKKTNIKPYFLSAIAIFVCIMGLTFILAWVPHLDSGDKNAANLFSTYQGIAAVSNAVALMSFSILASAMGFRYLTKEYCGENAILLFSYPMNRKSVVWAKVTVILLFISVAMFLTEFFGFLIFTGTDSILGMVNESLQISDFILAFRNALVLVCLTDGIILCAIRIGFIKKSNSVTIIAAVIWSLLLVNPVAAINEQFLPVLLLSAATLLGGILLTINLSHKVNRMEL